MPPYDYHCDTCNHTWDERRALGDHAVTCPECRGVGRHVFAPTRFRFVGGARQAYQRPPSRDDEVYSRTYEPGERVGDPMLDDGFGRVE